MSVDGSRTYSDKHLLREILIDVGGLHAQVMGGVNRVLFVIPWWLRRSLIYSKVVCSVCASCQR